MRYILTALIMICTSSQAAPKDDWILSDLSATPELAAFLGDADAVITTVPKKKDGEQAIRPTIFVYKLAEKPKAKLNSAKEWLAFLNQYIKNNKRVILSEEATKTGRYILEFTSKTENPDTDLRSLYLAVHAADGSVSLFVYDGLGPSTASNLPLVRSLYGKMDSNLLGEMYQADLTRRKKN